MKPSEKSRFGLYFLLVTITIYVIIGLFNINNLIKSLNSFQKLFIQVIPTIILVIIFMIIVDLLLSGEKIKKFITNLKGIKGWIMFGLTGVISSGPIYLWYPFLANLKKKGIRTGFLVSFLYNRAIKFQLIPIMITIFSYQYIIILFILMFIASIIQGKIVEMILEKETKIQN